MKHRWLPAAFLLTLGLALRLGYSLRLPPVPQQPDAYVFDGLAWNLAQNHTYGNPEPTAGRPPTYPFFLASVYKLAGHEIPAARAVQGILGTALVFLLMQCALLFGMSRRASLLVGLMGAFYPFLIYYEGTLLSESLIPFLTVLGFWAFFRWKENAGAGRAALWGLVFACLTLGRVAFGMIFAASWVIEALLLLRAGSSAKAWRGLIIGGLVFAAPVLLWGLRNEHAVGKFTLDSHGGYTLLDCVVYYDLNKSGDMARACPELPACAEGMKMSEVESDRYWKGEVHRFIRENPGVFAKQALANFKDFWRFYPRQDLSFQEGNRKLTWISLLTEPFFIVIGLLGFWATRKRWQVLHPIYFSIAGLTAIHMISCAQMRYRLPLMPFFIFMTGFFISRWVRPRDSD